MLDAILHSLNAFREGTDFPSWLPYLRIGGVLILGLCWGAALAVLQPEDVLADVRAALRHAGLTDKEVTGYFGGSRGNCADRLSGERALTVQKLATLPIEFWQWLYVIGNRRVGCPALVQSGSRLARRQARMSLASTQKEGVA